MATVRAFATVFGPLRDPPSVPASAPMAPADQLTTAPAGWGVVYRPGHRIGAGSLHNSSPSPHVLIPVALPPPLRGGSLENMGQKTEKSKRGQKNFYKNASLMWGIRT
uniref:Uncharacterized protein n=1 Tax=Siphoviridae sp. ctoiW10 TaxID=2827592 RepID=A0A8S5LPP7_9CAUD|nr:MAG TPA: hypothetical protein [Siphoviridae sp. ctoiW10]